MTIMFRGVGLIDEHAGLILQNCTLAVRTPRSQYNVVAPGLPVGLAEQGTKDLRGGSCVKGVGPQPGADCPNYSFPVQDKDGYHSGTTPDKGAWHADPCSAALVMS